MYAIRSYYVKENIGFVPPHGSGASLYIRPLLIGTGPEIGVKPSPEYLFMVFVMPVGPYFPEGFKPTELVIYRHRITSYNVCYTKLLRLFDRLAAFTTC